MMEQLKRLGNLGKELTRHAEKNSSEKGRAETKKRPGCRAIYYILAGVEQMKKIHVQGSVGER
jgi:hypothetical protein